MNWIAFGTAFKVISVVTLALVLVLTGSVRAVRRLPLAISAPVVVALPVAVSLLCGWLS